MFPIDIFLRKNHEYGFNFSSQIRANMKYDYGAIYCYTTALY